MKLVRRRRIQITGPLLAVLLLPAILGGQQEDAQSPARTFIQNTRGIAPRPNLRQTLHMFSEHYKTVAKESQSPLRAADLGAGAGNETLHLLKQGWDVVAIDVEPFAIATIEERASALRESDGDTESGQSGKLETRLTSMQEMMLEESSFDLINASLSLPFVSQEELEEVWKKIERALKPGGVFTGHFFGPDHAWKERPNMSFVSVRHLVRDLISSDLEVRFLLNEKENVQLGIGGTAFFHTITVIAQKRVRKEP